MSKSTMYALLVLAVPVGIAVYLRMKEKKRASDIVDGKIPVGQ